VAVWVMFQRFSCSLRKIKFALVGAARFVQRGVRLLRTLRTPRKISGGCYSARIARISALT